MRHETFNDDEPRFAAGIGTLATGSAHAACPIGSYPWIDKWGTPIFRGWPHVAVAALVLIGWYLIGPSTYGNRLHPEYPLDQWVHLDSFDSAAESKKAGFEAQAGMANKDNPLQTEQYRAWGAASPPTTRG
jgi:hypothetical protein